MKPDHELLTVSQMAQADASTIAAGTPGTVLMWNAGQAVANAVLARWSARPTLVLCGPGNNGGDGFVAACALRSAGWSVQVVLWGHVSALKGDAAWAAGQWLEVGGEIGQISEIRWSEAQLVIDALWGAGLSKPLDSAAMALLMQAQDAGVPVVAVDVPSGVWGDSGRSDGAIAADLTVTFFRKKPAHLLLPGKTLCGELIVADIGIAASVLPQLQVDTWVNEPALWVNVWPVMAANGHKYTRGHVAIFGGPRMTGAARLSAYGAARIGAGLTSIGVPEPAWPIYAAALNCIMVHALQGDDVPAWQSAWQAWLADQRLTALLVGPGAGEGAQALAQSALLSGRPVVLDADALTCWQGREQELFDLVRAHTRPVVLTPHEGEFARLFAGLTLDADSQSKLQRARVAARISGAIVLLKGPDTVVAAPDGRASILNIAPPWLGTAGAGDVLAGMIAGLLAQGMPAWEATCAAAWVHAQAACDAGRGLIADDLPNLIPAVLQRLLDH